MARVRTLLELRDEVRQRADMENSQFVSDAELDRYINESISELYDLIIESAAQEYYLDTYTINTVSGRDTYSLPSDFYVLKGVDADLGATRPVPIRPYMLNERHREMDTAWQEVQYRLLGAANIHGPDDTNTFMGTIDNIFTSGAPANNSFGVTGDSEGQAFQVGMEIGFRAPGSIIPINPTLQTTVLIDSQTGDVVTGIDLIGAGVVVGWEVYAINEGEYVPRIRFIPEPSGANEVTVWYIPHAPELTDDADVWNGFNGWEEYVVVDSAIKALEKEESDTSALEVRKERLMRRISSMSQARDQGYPDRVTDVTHNWFYRRW